MELLVLRVAVRQELMLAVLNIQGILVLHVDTTRLYSLLIAVTVDCVKAAF